MKFLIQKTALLYTRTLCGMSVNHPYTIERRNLQYSNRVTALGDLLLLNLLLLLLLLLLDGLASARLGLHHDQYTV